MPPNARSLFTGTCELAQNSALRDPGVTNGLGNLLIVGFNRVILGLFRGSDYIF